MISRNRTIRKALLRLVLLVIPVMLMLCSTVRAQGQAKDYLLLSEIKMKYLEQYAYRLDLSLAQWVAVLDLLQAY